MRGKQPRNYEGAGMVGNSKTFGKSEANRDFNLVPKVLSLENEKTLGMRLKSLFASDFPKIFDFPTIPAPS